MATQTNADIASSSNTKVLTIVEPNNFQVIVAAGEINEFPEGLEITKFLLWDLNANEEKGLEETTILVCRGKEYVVSLWFHDYGIPPDITKLASGFEGGVWENLCCENGVILKFTNLRNRRYRLDIFNSEGVCGAEYVEPSVQEVIDEKLEHVGSSPEV